MPIKQFPMIRQTILPTKRTKSSCWRKAFASGDQKFIASALGAVARARGMSTIAEKAGVNARPLYKLLAKQATRNSQRCSVWSMRLGSSSRWNRWLIPPNEAQSFLRNFSVAQNAHGTRDGILEIHEFREWRHSAETAYD